jgi:ribosome recycling factor
MPSSVFVFSGGGPVILRFSAALLLAVFATAASAQQVVNPKPLTEEERGEINAQRRAGCKAHGENLKMLQGEGSLMIEENGKQRELSKAERDSQIADTKKILETYCGEKPKDAA